MERQSEHPQICPGTLRDLYMKSDLNRHLKEENGDNEDNHFVHMHVYRCDVELKDTDRLRGHSLK